MPDCRCQHPARRWSPGSADWDHPRIGSGLVASDPLQRTLVRPWRRSPHHCMCRCQCEWCRPRRLDPPRTEWSGRPYPMCCTSRRQRRNCSHSGRKAPGRQPSMICSIAVVWLLDSNLLRRRCRKQTPQPIRPPRSGGNDACRALLFQSKQ